MIKPLIHDPFFLSGKSEKATKKVAEVTPKVVDQVKEKGPIVADAVVEATAEASKFVAKNAPIWWHTSLFERKFTLENYQQMEKIW